MADTEQELRREISRTNDRVTAEAQESTKRDSKIQERQAETAANIQNLTINISRTEELVKEYVKVGQATQIAVQKQADLHGALCEDHDETKKTARDAMAVAGSARDSATKLQSAADDAKAKRLDWRKLGFYLLAAGICGSAGILVKYMYDLWISKGG